MFDTMTDTLTLDAVEQALAAEEATIARSRARQAAWLRAADTLQAVATDGSRSLAEWTAARLDLAPDTARRLVQAARLLADQPQLEAELAAGEISFDRAVETARLAATTTNPDLVEASRGYDLAGVRRLTARHRHLTPVEEEDAFAARYLALQPNLDHSTWKLWGQLPGVDGKLVEAALTQRSDQLPPAPDGSTSTRGQRHADALVSLAQDSLTTTASNENSDTSAPVVSVFIDGHLAAASGGEAGVTIAAGPRIGIHTLQELLCSGAVELTLTAGTPQSLGSTSRVVPPRLRRWLLWRDGGCTVGGCQSRYRLQAHHITPWSHGGQTEPDNLTTLCWYHHHVVIHGMGYRIDPTSPPHHTQLQPPPTRSPP